MVKKIMFGILLHVIAKRGKSFASIMNDLAMLDEIIDSCNDQTNFNEKFFCLHIY